MKTYFDDYLEKIVSKKYYFFITEMYFQNLKSIFFETIRFLMFFFGKVNLKKIKISENFRKNRNFEIFDFHWLFHRFFFELFLISKNIFRTFSPKFFDEKKTRWKNSVYLYRSEISPRFRKSHLENCAMSLESSQKKVILIFPILHPGPLYGDPGSDFLCVVLCKILFLWYRD